MKKKYHKVKILVTLIAFSLLLQSNVFSQNGQNVYYTSNGSENYEWLSAASWIQTDFPGDYNVDDKEVVIPNNRRYTITIAEDDYIVLNAGLKGQHHVTINVLPGATLIINGSISVEFWFKVNVFDTGQFFVYGDVTMHSGGSDNQAGQLVIDGYAYISGSLSGNGYITGSGTLIVGGTIDVEIDMDEDTINLNPMVCSPANLRGEVNFDAQGYLVDLLWEYDSDLCDEPVFFEVKRDSEIIAYVDFASKAANFTFSDDLHMVAGATPRYEVTSVYLANRRSDPAILDFINSPLPIELLHFTAKAQNDLVNIHWATAAEINNDFFTIEHSIDGSNWNILAFVQGAGNSNQVLDYNYKDENPVEGISYYRLKQTDFDGKYEYFAPVAVNYLNSTGKMEILNVTTNSFSMNVWFRNQDAQAVITVSDIYGRVLYNGNAAVSGFTEQLTIDFPRNYNGEIIAIRLQGQQNSDEKKFLVR